VARRRCWQSNCTSGPAMDDILLALYATLALLLLTTPF
jgi:hypothetical protein